jgi:hypothetical protein
MPPKGKRPDPRDEQRAKSDYDRLEDAYRAEQEYGRKVMEELRAICAIVHPIAQRKVEAGVCVHDIATQEQWNGLAERVRAIVNRTRSF